MNNLSWNSHKIDHLLFQNIGHKKAFLCSTDTVLGLIASVTQEGKNALDILKKRALKPYLIIIGSFDQLDYFIETEVKTALFPLFKAVWPGPVTLIVPAKKGLPSYCVSQENSIALRLPAHEGLQKVALQYKGIFSTSANISGMPVPKLLKEVDSTILRQITTIVIDDDIPTVIVPSTILDCTKKPYIIVREGAYKKEMLMKLLSNY
jgi:L-threonylcarbamoyladenylate synthase